MNFQTLISQLNSGLSPLAIVFGVLLLVSEVLGSVPSIKASSIYCLIKAIIQTIADQVLPKNPQGGGSTNPPTA